MKLSPRTIQLLKNFSSINSSILVKPGNVLSTVSVGKTVMAEATVTDEFPSQFAIYDLSRFLSVLSLYGSPEITLKEKTAVISEGRSKVNYTFADPKGIVAMDKNLSDIKLPPDDVVFSFTKENLQSVTRAIGTLGLPEICIGSDGSNITLSVCDPANPTADTFDLELDGELKTTKPFKFYIKTEKLLFLPDTYQVSVTNKGIAKFSAADITYLVTLEKTSKIES